MLADERSISSKALLQEAKSYGTNSETDIPHKKDDSGEFQKLPYPKSVFFIVVNEFCERFSYYGMKAILAIYLKNVLDYTPDKATVYYHAFSGLCYFTPLFGAMIADSLLGKFRTILYLSIVYAIGNVTLSVAATPLLDKGGIEALSLLGLLLIAIGTGGIKPCVSAFGGDQFKLPQQALQLSSFFSIFYFSINAGSLLSTAITPSLRKDVGCFGQDTCYSLAFSVPAALMIVALVVFVIGKPWYTMRPVKENIVAKVISCVTHAVVRRGEPKRDHWLDKADDIYDRQLIDDIKVLFKILVLFVPLPVFWALFDQQGSRWTFQATRMDGEVFGFQIKPDQIQIVNPVLILALIPIFDQMVYPIFSKIGIIRTPLQKMTAGGVLAAAAFGISALLEFKLEPTYEVVLKANQSHLNFINTLPCNATLKFDPNLNKAVINSMQNELFKKIEAGEYKVSVSGSGSDPICQKYNNFEYSFKAEDEKAHTFTIFSKNDEIVVKKDATEDELMKSKEGGPKLKLILTGLDEYVARNASLLLRQPGSKENVKVLDLKKNVSRIFETEPQEYDLYLEFPGVEETMSIDGSIKPNLGGNYILSLTTSNQTGTNKIVPTLYTVTEPNSVHMVWLLPQYFVITVAEILFSISGLEFSYSQAPASMKSVVSAAWLLTVAFGNVIVIIVAEYIKFSSQAYEFLLFAGLMVGDMVLFAFMAYFYTPTEVSEEEEKSSDVQMKPAGTNNSSYEDDN